MSGGGPVGVVATWIPKAGNEDAILEILREMTEASRAEPGCRYYQAHRVPEGFVLYEQYDDLDAIEAHRATEHYQRLVAGRAVDLLERREIVRGEVL